MDVWGAERLDLRLDFPDGTTFTSDLSGYLEQGRGQRQSVVEQRVAEEWFLNKKEAVSP
jgi:hypothetical protein